MAAAVLQYVFNGDPVYAAWGAKSIKARMTTFVRSNQAYEIPI